jgi:DNA-binding transcriptional MerR regulator
MNTSIEKVLRVLKHQGIAQDTSDTELAKLTGLSRQTITKNKQAIAQYLLTAAAPNEADIAYVRNRTVDVYVDIALTSGASSQHFLQVMGAVAGYVLRYNSDLINHLKTPKSIVRVGREYIKLITQVASRKGSNGTPVHSQSGAAEYLLTEINNSTLVSTLFTRSNSYRTDAYSKYWKLTPAAEQLNNEIVEATIKVVDKYNKAKGELSYSPLHIGDSLCSEKSVNLGQVNYQHAQDYFSIKVSDLKALSVRSFIQVMSIAHPSPHDCITVPLSNLSRVDPEKGRIYNIFSRLKKDERKALGYNNYDINGGLQIICFNILTHFPSYEDQSFYDLHAAYPLIFSYGNDPESKKALREQIAKDLGKSIDEVKALLIAYSNGSKKKVTQSEQLKAFSKESDQLRREVVATIRAHQPELLESAIEQSKHSFPEDMDWQSIEKEATGQESRDKASVFFFIWTYFEKQIRDAMLSVVDDGIPVHDAIYSKQVVDYKVFEKTVLNVTGFDVKIGG